MQLIFPIVFIFISLKLVKWKNWEQYYPTVLFMIAGNLLYGYVFKNYPMWRFEHTFEESLLPTRMSINLLKTFTTFPILILMYLSHFPEKQHIKKRVVYILFWTLLFVLIELLAKLLGMISYHHGWNMWWSLLFDFVMFIVLGIHYKKPIVAWILSSIFILFLWWIFNINIELLE